MFNTDLTSEKQIDHINGVKTDNRVENLRLVSSMENHWNRHTARGYTKRYTGKYQAAICTDGVITTLGTFSTEDEARSAYEQAKNAYRNIKVA